MIKLGKDKLRKVEFSNESGTFTLLIRNPNFAESITLKCISNDIFSGNRETKVLYDELGKLIAGWEGVGDENGAEIPYTFENLNCLIAENPDLADSISKALLESIVVKKKKS